MLRKYFSLVLIPLIPIVFFSCTEETEATSTGTSSTEVSVLGTWKINGETEATYLTTNEDVSIPTYDYSQGTGAIVLDIVVNESGCDEGYVEDCADSDCCPESWIGDGFQDCEDQIWGCDLTCYDNDGGDCDTLGGHGTDPGQKESINVYSRELSLELSYFQVNNNNNTDTYFNISNVGDPDYPVDVDVYTEVSLYCSNNDFNDCELYLNYYDESTNINIWRDNVSVGWDNSSFTLTLNETDLEYNSYDISLSGAITSSLTTFAANVQTLVEYDIEENDDGFYSYLIFNADGTVINQQEIVCSEVEPYGVSAGCDYGCGSVYDSDGDTIACEELDCSSYSNQNNCWDHYQCSWEDGICIDDSSYYDYYDYDYYGGEAMMWSISGDQLTIYEPGYPDYSMIFAVSLQGSNIVLTASQNWCDYHSYYYDYYSSNYTDACDYSMLDDFYGLSSSQVSSYIQTVSYTLIPSTIPSAFGTGSGSKVDSPLFRLIKRNNKDIDLD